MQSNHEFMQGLAKSKSELNTRFLGIEVNNVCDIHMQCT